MYLNFTEHVNQHLKAEAEMIRFIGRGDTGEIFYADAETAWKKRRAILQKIKGTDLKVKITQRENILEVKRL